MPRRHRRSKGGEISDKERIAELADAFNRVCDENADFIAESIKADRRIAELEAEVMEFRSRGNVTFKRNE